MSVPRNGPARVVRRTVAGFSPISPAPVSALRSPAGGKRALSEEWQMSSIASIYVALSALLVLALAVQVVILRRGKRIGLGDGGDTRLACAIRAHANALENLPLALLLLEIGRASCRGRCVSACRSRGSPVNDKKKKKTIKN